MQKALAQGQRCPTPADQGLIQAAQEIGLRQALTDWRSQNKPINLCGVDFIKSGLAKAGKDGGGPDAENQLSGIDLSGADLAYADFGDTYFWEPGVNLKGAKLFQTNLSKIESFTRCFFPCCNHAGVEFDENILQAKLNDSQKRYFSRELAGRTFVERGKMVGYRKAMQEQRQAKRNDEFLFTLRNAKLVNQDLSGIDFSGVVFDCSDLSQSNLSNTKFDEAVITHSEFAGANLRGANFRKVRVFTQYIDPLGLIPVKTFEDADLRQATFGQAEIDIVVFRKADLRETDIGPLLTSCGYRDFRDANFQGINLKRFHIAKAQETCESRSDNVLLFNQSIFAAQLNQEDRKYLKKQLNRKTK